MPFSFYYAPYRVTTLKNYDPVNYYEKLIELFSHCSSGDMLKRRMKSTSNRTVKLINWARTVSTRANIRGYRRILEMLRSDAQFRAFHEGRSEVLPDFYFKEYERMLGPYAELLSRADRTPSLEPVSPELLGRLGERAGRSTKQAGGQELPAVRDCSQSVLPLER